MKRVAIFFISMALIFASTDSFSQGAPKPIVGVKGGLNLANIGGDETDNSLKMAFHGGAYSEVFFNYFLMMQAEFLLSYQGHGGFDPDIAGSSSLSLWYLNIPVMARYNIGYNLNVHAGIQMGLLLSGKSKIADPTAGSLTFDVKDQFKALDWGIPIGVGYDFGDRDVSVMARYIIPINNISSDAFFKRTNSVFQVSVGLKIATLDNL
ncbi:MAG: porin family protein [Bacteroidota bacterium]